MIHRIPSSIVRSATVEHSDQKMLTIITEESTQDGNSEISFQFETNQIDNYYQTADTIAHLIGVHKAPMNAVSIFHSLEALRNDIRVPLAQLFEAVFRGNQIKILHYHTVVSIISLAAQNKVLGFDKVLSQFQQNGEYKLVPIQKYAISCGRNGISKSITSGAKKMLPCSFKIEAVLKDPGRAKGASLLKTKLQDKSIFSKAESECKIKRPRIMSCHIQK